MKFEQKISCIISAYNEEKNLSRVLGAIKDLKWIDEILVVDDASEDKTLEIAQSFKLKNLKIIKHAKNRGKGAAMATGAKLAKHNLLLFLDADLVGLKEEHLLKILSPIIFTREANLALGVFGLKKLNVRTGTKFANRMFPSITGQRAIWRKFLPPLQRLQKSRWGADLLITKNIPRKQRAIVKLNGLAQVRKEEKTDLVMEAIKARIKMYQEVTRVLKEEP